MANEDQYSNGKLKIIVASVPVDVFSFRFSFCSKCYANMLTDFSMRRLRLVSDPVADTGLHLFWSSTGYLRKSDQMDLPARQPGELIGPIHSSFYIKAAYPGWINSMFAPAYSLLIRTLLSAF